MATMTDYWAKRAHEDLARSVLCLNRFQALAEVAQPLFRDAMVGRIGRYVGHTARAVDLGCGLGDWTRAYLAFADTAVGVDVNDAFVAEAGRGAWRHGVAARCRFEQRALSDLEIPRAGLIALGGCAQYFEYDELHALFAGIAAAQAPGDVFYLRTTVTTLGRSAFATENGRYRSATYYESLAKNAGYRPVERAYSATVLCEALAGPRSIQREAVSLATASLAAPLWAARQLVRRSDYLNWVFVRRRP